MSLYRQTPYTLAELNLRPEQRVMPARETLEQRMARGIGEFLLDQGIVSDPTSAQSVGEGYAGLLGFLPGIGDAQAGDELAKAVQEGDSLGMGLGLLSALPVIGRPLKSGGEMVKEIVKDGRKVGHIKYFEDDDNVQIVHSFVEPEYRGQGLAKNAYQDFIKENINKGKNVLSDSILKNHATKFYDKLDGYNVQINPSARQGAGRKTTMTLKEEGDQMMDAPLAIDYPTGAVINHPDYRAMGEPLYMVSDPSKPLPEFPKSNYHTVPPKSKKRKKITINKPKEQSNPDTSDVTWNDVLRFMDQL